MRVALAQINTTVGDLDGNVEKVLKYAADARDLACDVVAFPELTITGYPPEDLLRRRDFVTANQDALKRIARDAPRDLALVVGFVDGDEEIYNAAAIIENGEPCDGKAQTRGLCRKHYIVCFHNKMLDTFGLPPQKKVPKYSVNKERRETQCRITELGVICEHDAYYKGVCRDHYLKLLNENKLKKFTRQKLRKQVII